MGLRAMFSQNGLICKPPRTSRAFSTSTKMSIVTTCNVALTAQEEQPTQLPTNQFEDQITYEAIENSTFYSQTKEYNQQHHDAVRDIRRSSGVLPRVSLFIG